MAGMQAVRVRSEIRDRTASRIASNCLMQSARKASTLLSSSTT